MERIVSAETILLNGSPVGGGITAGIYAEYTNNADFQGSSPGTEYYPVFNTVVSDLSSIYTDTGINAGRITIPASYVGVARGRIKATYLLNSSAQNVAFQNRLYKNGVFQKYGWSGIINNPSGRNYGFVADFEFEGVANDYFRIPFLYEDNGFTMAGGAMRLEIQIYPK